MNEAKFLEPLFKGLSDAAKAKLARDFESAKADPRMQELVDSLNKSVLKAQVKLPEFGPRAELFDVEGIPVSLFPDAPGVPSSMAWDSDPPRRFDPGSARRNGAPVSIAEFGALVASFHAAP